MDVRTVPHWSSLKHVSPGEDGPQGRSPADMILNTYGNYAIGVSLVFYSAELD